jgi:hypothetical protein
VGYRSISHFIDQTHSDPCSAVINPDPYSADHMHIFTDVCLLLSSLGTHWEPPHQGDDASSIACLESVDPDTLLGVGARCDPVVDGVDLTDQILTLYRDGATAPGVPVLAGSVREDLGFLPGECWA